MSIKGGGGGKRPYTRTIPEPLETWLPKSQKGTPPLNWKDVYQSSITHNAYYQLRHYEIKVVGTPPLKFGQYKHRHELIKHGTITGLSRQEFVMIINILRQTIGKADYRTTLHILGGHAVRNAVLIQSSYMVQEKDRRLFQIPIEVDARRNFQNTGTGLSEDFYYV